MTTFYTLRVMEVRPETDQAIRITFSVPADLQPCFRRLPGQYLTVRVNIAGIIVTRCYSICAGVQDETLQIAIKRVQGGVVSNWLNDHAVMGMDIDVAPPQGNFCAHVRADHAATYCFIASGSGITPVISNIRSILAIEPDSQVTLLYGNQRLATMMFREQLSFLKNAHMTRLHWVNIFSRDDQGCDILNGRLNNRKGAELNRRLINLQKFDEYFICGPESMISEISRGLRQFGIPESRIHYELFAASADDARQVVAKHQARAKTHAGKTSQVTIVRDGRSTTFDVRADGENILDAGLAQGLDLPFSCKGGVCSTCKARLIEGRVDMDISHGLEAHEIQAGLILTCQSHPVTDAVTLDFDRR